MLFTALCGCQTYQLKVVTNPPDADVMILDPKTQSYRNAGKSPLELNSDQDGGQLFSMLKGADLITLTVEKPGYVIEHFLIDRAVAPKQTLNLALKPVEATPVTGVRVTADESLVADRVGTQIQGVMRQIDRGEYASAHATVARLIESYPLASILWDMRGSLALLKGDADDAARSFKQSLALKPENAETQAALQKLGH